MRTLGGRGEDMAVRFLKGKGYRIIGRNFRCPAGEIDIIARDGGTLVFVEVKTRTDSLFGHPIEAVHSGKRRKFDIVSITMKAGGKEIEHIQDAFGVGDPL
jgi:putative endonuclease